MTIATPPEYEAGTTLGGYRIERKEPLERLRGHFYELVHEKTGARHIHIAVPDDNNTFIVQFPTVPESSTGVAHILEHTVLSGSERYPVPDAFKSMSTRSLKTFMNASTGGDATYYYYSTRNTKDFFNLLSVYLDAVFFPKLTEDSFKQEGHRLEFEQLDDPGSGLRFKGVVFNEMKGQMSTPPVVVFRALGKALFPDLTYAEDSGGDPAVMPELTWEELRDFHATHYHPSNAFFFTYGSLPLSQVLEKIEGDFLSSFERIDVDFSIPDQPRFSEPRVFEDFYPLSKEEDPNKKSQILTTWATTNIANTLEVTALHVLDNYLLGNPASPLRKALIDSGVGDALNDIHGFIPAYREPTFVAGLKGVNPSDADEIERLIFSTLEKIVGEGVDKEQVDAAIHQLEIEQSEISNAGVPFAFKLFSWFSGAYVHGGDVYRALQIDEDLRAIEEQRRKEPYFENLIKKYLLENSHRSRIIVSPDQELEARRENEELTRLAELEKGLSDNKRSHLVEDARRLKKLQEAKPDLSILPTLELSDVPMVFEEVPHSMEEIDGARVGFFPLPTNGLTYVDIRVSFEGLPDDLKDYLPLFAYAVPKLGAGDYDYVAMSNRIASFTGGVGAQVGVRPRAGTEDFNQSFTLTGKALVRNNANLLAIYKDILTGLKFDPRRLREILMELRAQKESLVVFAGHQYATYLAASKLKPVSAVDERLHGLTQLALLKELSTVEDLDDVIAKLEAIRNFLFRSRSLAVCVTSEDGSMEELQILLREVLAALPGEAPESQPEPELAPRLKHEARTISVPVAYNAKVYPSVGIKHPDAPDLKVLGTFMRSTYLHREIREKGGAYGSYSLSDPEKGLFAFWSYRDPNIVRTFQVFESAVQEVVKGDIDPQDLKEAILTACGEVDPLESPDTKGRRRFFDDLAGYSLELRSQYKQGLLEVTQEDLRRVAETYLSGDGAALASISSAEKIAEANKELGDLFEVKAI